MRGIELLKYPFVITILSDTSPRERVIPATFHTELQLPDATVWSLRVPAGYKLSTCRIPAWLQRWSSHGCRHIWPTLLQLCLAAADVHYCH